MQSLFLNSLNDNDFICFPHRSLHVGVDQNNNYIENIDELAEKFKSIEELKNYSSHTIWKYSESDTKKLFEKNLKVQPDDWYYRNNEVNYTLNSLGYRTKEFDKIDWKNSIVIFGCSSVLGVGVDDCHTLPFFLEQEIGLPVINMGIVGSSNQFHIHNVSVLMNKYPTPKCVILKQSTLLRLPVYSWNHVGHRGSWDLSNHEVKNDGSNIVIHNLIANNIIENMCESKTTYINCSSAWASFKFLNELMPNRNIHLLDNDELNPIDWARDFIHTGINGNKLAAKSLSKIIKSKLN